MRNRLLFVTAALVAASVPSLGAIACGITPTNISAITAGGGCTNGANTFTNVSIAGSSEAPGTGVHAIDPGFVQLAFTNNANFVNVILSDSDAASWALSGTQQFNLILTYTVTGGLPAYFTSVSDSFNGSGSGTSGNFGAVTYDKTAGNVTLATLSLASTSNAPTAFPGAPIQTFNVTDTIHVQANGGTATVVNATNSFTVTPEPATTLMLASGLFALGCAFRRRPS